LGKVCDIRFRGVVILRPSPRFAPWRASLTEPNKPSTLKGTGAQRSAYHDRCRQKQDTRYCPLRPPCGVPVLSVVRISKLRRPAVLSPSCQSSPPTSCRTSARFATRKYVRRSERGTRNFLRGKLSPLKAFSPNVSPAPPADTLEHDGFVCGSPHVPLSAAFR